MACTVITVHTFVEGNELHNIKLVVSIEKSGRGIPLKIITSVL